jgi:hypothetical protein
VLARGVGKEAVDPRAGRHRSGMIHTPRVRAADLDRDQATVPIRRLAHDLPPPSLIAAPRRDLTNRKARLMGSDDGPGPLLLGRFQSFGGQAEPDGKPLFATNPFFQRVVGFHPSRLRIDPLAVQQTGRHKAGFWSNATRAPFVLLRRRPFCSVLLQRGGSIQWRSVRILRIESYPKPESDP